MSVQWPTTIPATPLLDGYSSARQNNRVESNVDAGLSKQRARFMAVPKQVSEQFIMNNAEKTTFENFYDNTLEGGSLQFTKESPETGVNTIYRFSGDSVPEYEVAGYGKGGTIWRITLSLEILPQ